MAWFFKTGLDRAHRQTCAHKPVVGICAGNVRKKFGKSPAQMRGKKKDRKYAIPRGNMRGKKKIEKKRLWDMCGKRPTEVRQKSTPVKKKAGCGIYAANVRQTSGKNARQKKKVSKVRQKCAVKKSKNLQLRTAKMRATKNDEKFASRSGKRREKRTGFC